MGCLVGRGNNRGRFFFGGGGGRTRLSDSGCGGAVQTLAVANQLFLILSHFEVCKRDEG